MDFTCSQCRMPIMPKATEVCSRKIDTSRRSRRVDTTSFHPFQVGNETIQDGTLCHSIQTELKKTSASSEIWLRRCLGIRLRKKFTDSELVCGVLRLSCRPPDWMHSARKLGCSNSSLASGREPAKSGTWMC